MWPISTAIVVIFLSAGSIFGQTDRRAVAEPGAGSPEIIHLQVPVGAPLPVVLDQEVRIRKTGHPIQGKIAEPVFAFDKLVVPAGSEVTGSVTRIAGVSIGIAAFSSDDMLNRTLDGASGYRLIGVAVSALSSSRTFAIGFGVYVAGMSVFNHFLSRGQEVVYPRDTAMAIGFGSRAPGSNKSPTQ